MFEEICKFDKHKPKTGRLYYVAKQPAKEAQEAMVTYKSVLGDPVEWPTEEELAAGEEASKARIASFWQRNVNRQAKGADAGMQAGGGGGGSRR